MAYRVVKVKKGDTFASLAQANQVSTADLLKLNRGVPQLSTGQVIKVPQAQYPGHGTIGVVKLPTSGYVGTYGPPNNMPVYGPPVLNDTRGNYPGHGTIGGVYGPPAPTLAQQAASPQNQFLSQFPGQGTITGQTQTTSGTLIDPNVFRAAGTATQARPTGTYTGDPLNNPNDAAWVNYWNDQAANPPSNPPPVMTADQIWNMKAAQRRRQQEQAAADGPKEPKYQPIVTQNVAWRVG